MEVNNDIRRQTKTHDRGSKRMSKFSNAKRVIQRIL